MEALTEPIIGDKGRTALLNYKYHGSSKSWLDTNVMNAFWEFVVTLVPLNVAPNVLTFTATLVFLWAYACFEWFCDDMKSCPPRWVWYQLSIAMFIYQTLDAIDGKQARRTGSSSPLGQLFDHGNDALIFSPMVIAGMGALQYGTTWTSHIVLMCGYVVFYMLNWRARHEGVMTFGIFSVTEAQYIGVCLWIATGFFGCDLWTMRFPLLYNMSFRSLICITCIPIAIVTSILEYKAVRKHYKDTNTRDRGSIIELCQMLLFIAAFTAWKSTGAFADHTVLVLWCECIIFSGLIHRLIVADVTHANTRVYHNLLLLLPFLCIFSVLEGVFGLTPLPFAMNSAFTAYGLLAYVVACWSIYVLRVIHEVCDTLDIHVFLLSKKQK